MVWEEILQIESREMFSNNFLCCAVICIIRKTIARGEWGDRQMSHHHGVVSDIKAFVSDFLFFALKVKSDLALNRLLRTIHRDGAIDKKRCKS